MKPNQLFLRCYAECKDGQWQAFCIDFSLAAQADTFKEARQKLESMIGAYLYDALVGEDRAHARQLLMRTAPWEQQFTYWLFASLHHIGLLSDGLRRLFTEVVPLTPGKPYCA